MVKVYYVAIRLKGFSTKFKESFKTVVNSFSCFKKFK